MGAEETRVKILNCTAELIVERGGDISTVTIRTIAERVGVGVGLTNHYFKSKELLLFEVVDAVFSKIYNIFDEAKQIGNSTEAVRTAADGVMKFFLHNEAYTRAAFLLEGVGGRTDDYTTRLVQAFALCMVDQKKLDDIKNNSRINDRLRQQLIDAIVNEQKIKAFMLVSTMKDSFHRRELLGDVIGIDIMDEEACEEYIDNMIEALL